MCSVPDETTWWKKTAGNHYEAGKQGIARAAKKTEETLRDNTLALGSGKEESAKWYLFSNLSSGAN